MHFAELQIISLEKRRIIVKTFAESQFNYCPLIWMLHSRTLNNKINRLHERVVLGLLVWGVYQLLIDYW